MKSLLLALLLAQVNAQVDIVLRNGTEVRGKLDVVYAIGLRVIRPDGNPAFLPYDNLPGYWQAQCRKSKHHSKTELITTMEDL